MFLSLKEDFHGLGVDIEQDTVSAPRRFQAVFDTADTPALRPFLAAFTAAQDGNIAPQRYDQHPYNSFLFVTNVRVRQSGKGPCLFNVDVTYGNRGVTGREGVQLFANPVDQPWDIRWYTVPFSERLDEGINPLYPDEEYPLEHPVAIENVLGESADPPLQDEFAYLGCQIIRNVATWAPETMHQYVKAINSDAWWGFAAGKVLCNSIEATRKRNGNIFYWVVQYEFLFSAPGWVRRLLNESYHHRELDADGLNALVSNVDKNGLRLARPLKIDWDGLPLHKKGDVVNGVTVTEDDTPLWLFYETKKKKPFSGLGLF